MSNPPAGRIPRPPQMTGLYKRSHNRHLMIAFALSTVAAGAYKLMEDVCFYNKVEKFEKTYDMDKDFERKMKAGIFQSVDSNGVYRFIGEDE